MTGTHWGWLIQRSKFIHLFFCSNLENKTQWQLPGSPWHTLSPIERATCSQFRFPRGKNPSALPGRCPLGSPRLGPQGWGCAAGGRGDGPQPLLSSRQACLGAAVLCFRTRTPQPSPGSGERMGRVRGWPQEESFLSLKPDGKDQGLGTWESPRQRSGFPQGGEWAASIPWGKGGEVGAGDLCLLCP